MLCSTPMTIAKFLLTRNNDKQPLESNRMPLFVNWIIQYFVSGLQNYRFSYLRTLHDCIGVLQFLWKLLTHKKKNATDTNSTKKLSIVLLIFI